LSLPKRFANQYCVYVCISYFAIQAAHPAHRNLPVIGFLRRSRNFQLFHVSSLGYKYFQQYCVFTFRNYVESLVTLGAIIIFKNPDPDCVNNFILQILAKVITGRATRVY